jgi:alpha-D-xyloside xylohydrolase
VDVLRKFTKLKCSLMPYLYEAARQAHLYGTPMLRAMFMEFPDDPACNHLDLQYMLGDSLLVAPVFSHDDMVNYYVPDGVWTNLLNGGTVQGPRWVRETHDALSLPLLVRPNTVLPMSDRTDRPDYDYGEDVVLKIFQFENGRQVQVEIPDLAGNTESIFRVQRANDTLHIERDGPFRAWKVLLVNVHSIELDQPFEKTIDGVLLSFDASLNAVEVKYVG